jgi:hypothetical protein
MFAPFMPFTSRVARASRVAVRLTSRDLLMIGEALILMPVVEVGLRTMPIHRLLCALGRQGANGARESAVDVRRAARIVETLARFYPFRPTCLKKSLVLLRLARRRGLPAELRIGVKKASGEFSAHAWIECGGLTLLPGDGVEQYQVLPGIR